MGTAPPPICEKCGTRMYGERHACVPKTEQKDMVHNPAHYARWKMQPIEFIAVNNLPYWLANVIKYTCRFDAKDGLQDLYKARSYLDMKIAEMEGQTDFWKPRLKVK